MRWPVPCFFSALRTRKAVERSAGDGDGDHDGVGAHGESSDGVGVPGLGAHFIEKDLADQLRAAASSVVVRQSM